MLSLTGEPTERFQPMTRYTKIGILSGHNFAGYVLCLNLVNSKTNRALAQRSFVLLQGTKENWRMGRQNVRIERPKAVRTRLSDICP